MAFDVSSIFAEETSKGMQVRTGQAVDVPRSPETLGSEIRYLSAQAKSMTVWFGVEIGKRLAEAKEMVGHGGWLDFLKNETEFSSSSAGRFMQIAREYGGKSSNFPTLGNLSVSNALRLLAVPEEERAEFAQAVDAEHLSSRELEQAIRERDEARRALEEERAASEGAALKIADLASSLDEQREAAAQLKETNSRQAEQIRELENRPVEVAVQAPDPAEIEKAVADALAAAEKRHKAALDSAERLRKAAEKKQAELQAEAAQAMKDVNSGKLKEDALNAKLATLQKELDAARAEQTAAAKASSIQSDADVAVFQSFFQATLENFNKACGLLTKVKLRDADKADKLLRFSRDAVAKMAAALEKEG